MITEQSMSVPTHSMTGQTAESAMGMTTAGQMPQDGHLYMQTNEIRNFVVHYTRGTDGRLTEVGRIPTGGAGSGTYKPVSGQESAPNAFEGANSVTLTPDRRFLFATNGGDNSVSSFAVGVDGKLALLDAMRTGNVVNGRSGTAKALAYCPSHRTLYVVHSFGPDHLRLMSVDEDGKLSPRPERYTINTMDKPNRVATIATPTPDEKFLVVGTTFDEPASTNPDGSPILWVQKNGVPHSIASNAPDPDGLIVFPWARTARWANPNSRMGAAALPGTRSSCTTGQISSSSVTPWATGWLWPESTGTAPSPPARSRTSTPAAACPPNCAGW
jgi:hypothetical protein